MPAPILYCGDTSLATAASYLAGLMHRAGLANIATSSQPDDGLQLRDVYIASAVRCAPPGNQPTPDEVAACRSHLEAELAHLPRVETVVALGKIAWDAWLQVLARHTAVPRPRPAFAHGAIVRWNFDPAAAGPLRNGVAHRLVGCYHPSRQNTNTGVLTPEMYDQVFQNLLIG